jgi:hypothetical protein
VDRRIWVAVGVALVAILVAVAVGNYAYQAGLARGLADAGKLPALAPGVPYPYFVPYWHHGFFGFGFLLPLLFLFLFFGLLRRAYWGRGWSRTCEGGVPGRFEEWHRRAHESMERGGQSV